MRRVYPCRCNNEEGASISFAATTEQQLCCLFAVCLFVCYPIVLNSGAKEERFFLFEKGKEARDDV
jgi:hypothetical protein